MSVDENDNQRRPWEQREDETSRNFDAFCAYRDLGPSRSLREAWEIYREEHDLKADKPTGTFKEWSSRYEWVERSNAYDQHLKDLQVKSREQAVEEAEQKLADNLSDILTKAIEVAVERGDRKMLMDLMDRAGVRFNEDENSLDVNLNAGNDLTETIKDTLGASFNDMTQNDD